VGLQNVTLFVLATHELSLLEGRCCQNDEMLFVDLMTTRIKTATNS
jgi:hypothetical protein